MEEESRQGKKFTDFELGYMKGLLEMGETKANLSRKLGISRETVCRLINMDFQYVEKESKSQNILETDDEERIIQAVLDNRDLTAADVSRDKDLNPKKVSAYTIERLQNNEGLNARQKRSMKDITSQNKIDRFELSKIYKGWTKNKLNKIYYSDESNICVNQSVIQFCRKYDEEDWNDIRFRKSKKVWPVSINIWMLISKKGVEKIKWTSKNWIDVQYYRDNILSKYVINNEELKIGSKSKSMFQQDQAKGHMAKETIKLLEDNKINVILWPPKGADLSPIENCFSESQRRAKNKYSEIKIQGQLWKYICDMIFEDEFTEFIQKCYDNSKERWQSVYDNQGGPP